MSHHATEPDRAVVEQAKGVLMLRYGIDARASLAVLDTWAREAFVPIEDLADTLVLGICQGRVTQGAEVLVRWLEQRLRGGVEDLPGDTDEAAPRRAPTVASVTPPAPRTEAAPAPHPEVTAAPRPEVSAALGRRQWRYTSALHAARVLRMQ